MRPVERWALFATVLSSSMAFIDSTALNLILPALQKDLGASGADLLWITNAYAVLLAALLPAGGSLGDRFGHRHVCLTGIAIFTGASIACGLAIGTHSLIASRAVQGIGAALMLPGSLATLSAVFDADRRGRAIGAWSALSVVASALGPVLGGILAHAGLWRGAFFLNVPIALMASAALLLKIPEIRSPEKRPRADVRGAVLATLALASFNYGCIEASSAGFSGGRVQAALIGSVVAAALFIAAERRHPSPLLPLDLFKDRRFIGASVLILILHGGMYGILLLFPLNLIQAQGYPATSAGMTQLPLMGMLMAFSPIAGALVDRFGPRLPITLGSLLTGAGYFVLGIPELTAGPRSFWAAYLPALLLVGAGMGLVLTPLSATMMNAVSAKHAGVASGINSAISRLASVLGIAVLGSLAILSYRSTVGQDLPPLSAPVREALLRSTERLGDTRIPCEVAAADRPAVAQTLRTSFARVFRGTAWLVAGLAGLGAAVSFVLMKGAAGRKDGGAT